MDNISIYDDFLKNLKTAITNISVYFKDHPIVIKSINDLKENIDKIFSSASVLKIGITADYLTIGKHCLKGEKVYRDTAIFFHLRKVKNIEFKKEVSSGELQSFLEQTSFSPGDILARGGLAGILQKDRILNIIVKNLDYSQLLTGEGKECKDIWVNLLNDNFAQNNIQEIKELTKFSHNVLSGISVNDLVQDDRKREVIAKFFTYLQGADKNKFFEDSKDLSRSILNSETSFSPDSTLKLKNFLENIDAKGISEVLLERFQGKEKFNPLSLNLFAKIISEGKHENIASFLVEKIISEEKIKSDPNTINNIKQLFVLSGNLKVSEVYKRNLLSVFNGISPEGNIHFDRKQLEDNYRRILFELFLLEKDEEKLKIVIDSILLEIKREIDDNKFVYIQTFVDLIGKKQVADNSFDDFFKDTYEKVAHFIEKIVLKRGGQFLNRKCAKIVKAANIKPEDYLEMIFNEQEFNPNVLVLFFRIFPENIKQFYVYLNKSLFNIILMKKVVDGLGVVEVAQSSEVLKYIFKKSGDFIKNEVLKIMGKIVFFDKDFVFTVIQTGNFIQRKQTLSILLKNPDSLKTAARILLEIKNPFGINGRLIKENLQIVSAILFKESYEYVYALSKYRFFWNKDIRELANKILRKYDV